MVYRLEVGMNLRLQRDNTVITERAGDGVFILNADSDKEAIEAVNSIVRDNELAAVTKEGISKSSGIENIKQRLYYVKDNEEAFECFASGTTLFMKDEENEIYVRYTWSKGIEYLSRDSSFYITDDTLFYLFEDLGHYFNDKWIEVKDKTD